ncbi:MAG: PQQ-binding-like beta-propeller repeat protein, partial [Planctomycetes bacterium]|nr:PQQ-binding-like beta-propeller repeat protein [Planctomycetota bacterium]
KDAQGGGIDMATTKNVRWAIKLGAYAYGNPTAARGRVLVGTDIKSLAGDLRFTHRKGGLVKCLDEATGRLVWQLVTPERTALPPEMHFSQQHLGTCSSALVDGDRVFVMTSAGEVLCLDLHGRANGNQGPFQNEGQYLAGAGHPRVELTATDADILWCYDVVTELGVFIHDAASCSVLIHGDLVYVTTSNGVDKGHEKVLAPEAPVLIALDKHTGRLAARENEGISARLFHAQWSSPSLGVVNGRPLVFLGGGDGVCYALEALAKPGAGVANLKQVWSYDGNPPGYRFRDGTPIRYVLGDKRRKDSPNKNDGAYLGPSDIIATPVFHQGRIYVGIGQDPAHGRGRGLFHCIDATQIGDITRTGCVWSFAGLERTMATAAVAEGLVYVTDIGGTLYCLDADTGRCVWTYETGAETWGGPLLADGRVYFGNKKGLHILRTGREAVLLGKVSLGAPAYSTPIAANGVLYVTSQSYLWAVQTRP